MSDSDRESADRDTMLASPGQIPSAGRSQSAVICARYEVLGLLGAGAMGNVYKARDRELDDIVALKMLRPELALSTEALDRFKREVKLSRRVTHPNVARVFDIGEVDVPTKASGSPVVKGAGERFLTMEYVDGESLGAALSRIASESAGAGRADGISIGRVIEIASAICSGLSAAHAAGVVHRDLKPDNILVEKTGRIVITDFGIARAIAGSATKVTVNLVGTPAYMAPEQLNPSVPIDGRADLYALGAMLFEMLTGDLPWHGDSVIAVATARLYADPPDPRLRRKDLPAALAEAVLRCMAQKPEDRFGSAAEFATVLAAMTIPQASALLPRGPADFGRPPPDLARREFGRRPQNSTERRVAVLPFRFLGPAEDDYIADGLTDDLIDLLSMSKDLRVQSRGRVMALKGTSADPRELGRELGVDVVVDGTLRRSGDTMRINARLVSVSDGMQIWARRFDSPVTELLLISDDTARSVAEALTATIRPTNRKATADAEAIDLYLRARAAYHSFFTGDPDRVISLFKQAMERAPDDARIIAGYAMAQVRAWSIDRKGAADARDAAMRAVELAPDLADSHVALATVSYHSGDEAQAVTALRRALLLVEGNEAVHDLMGRLLAETSLTEHARHHLEMALLAEPNCVHARVELLRLKWFQGELAEAERQIEALDPRARMQVEARTTLWSGNVARARELLGQVASDRSQAVARALLEATVHQTRPYETLQAFCDASQASVRSRIIMQQFAVEAASVLGDLTPALTALERATSYGLFDLAWMDRCPPLSFIRNEPRFLLARTAVSLRANKVVEAYFSELPLEARP